MHRVLVFTVAALVAFVVGCVGKRSQMVPAANRPERIALTNSPPAFRKYDEAFVYSVQERWFDLLDSRSWDYSRKGTVLLGFTLHDNGRITDMEVLESTATEMLDLFCRKAILDLQPYPAWPRELREAVEGDSRRIRFIFYYQ